MVKLYDGGVYLVNGEEIVPEKDEAKVKALTGRVVSREEARKGTIAYNIIKDHNTTEDMEHLRLKFDALTSPPPSSSLVHATASEGEQRECQVELEMTW